MKDNLITSVKDIFIKYFPFVIVFSYSLFVPYDTDIGWHLKYGEYFFRHGQVLRENIFSTQMAGFNWINSSWATDLLTYLTFTKFGFLGISVVGALVITAVFYFFSKAAKLTFWEQSILFPTLLYLELPFIEVSFRGQQLTLLAFGILYYLFNLYTNGKKRAIYFFIPLFMLWSNFHGQFLLGLGIFFILLSFYIFQKYYFAQKGEERRLVVKEGKKLSFIFFLSLAATVINPFGLHIYFEAFKHFGNPLQKYIIEWLPFDRFSLLWWNLMFWEAIILISLGILLAGKKFFKNIYLIVPVILLLMLSVQVRRYTWVLLLVSIPIARLLVSAIKPKIQEISSTISILVVLFFYSYIIFIKSPNANISSLSWDRYCVLTGCSAKAAEFLQNYKYEGRLMTFYNWGGWLIWKYPQIKTSIDGRMHLWKDAAGYSGFLDYYQYEQNNRDIDQSDYNVVFMTPGKPINKRLVELVKLGKWKTVYSDSNAVIYQRVKVVNN